jgi:hypothetical protein
LNYNKQRITRGAFIGLVLGLLGGLAYAPNASGQNPDCLQALKTTMWRGSLNGLTLGFAVSLISDPESDVKFVAGEGVVVTYYYPIVPCPVTETTYTLDPLGGNVKLAVSDVNGDGVHDVVAVDYNNPLVYVLPGLGNGLFGTPYTIPLGGYFPSAVTAGDIDGDGKADIITVNTCGNDPNCTSPGTVSVFQGNGNGTFGIPVTFAVGLAPVAVSDEFPFTLANTNSEITVHNLAADFNGDGHQDVAVVNNGDNTVSVLLGNADGTFQPQRTFPTAASPVAVVIGDLNGDNHLDLAVAAPGPFPGVVSVLLGNGDGTFQPKVDYPVGTNPASLTVGDFNRDGKLDLAAANLSDHTVSVLMGNGDGTLKPKVDYPSGGQYPSFVTTFDDNGDGALDLVVANKADTTFSANGNLVTLLGRGDGTFEVPVNYTAGSADISAPGLATADLNGDGNSDIIVSNGTDNDVSVFLNVGDGTFGPKTSFPTVSPGANAVATGDFNGDGKPDVVVATNATNLNLFLGNGAGTLQPAVNLVLGFGLHPTGIVAADLNGDGKLDIVTGNFGGGVAVLLGNGNGTFQPAVGYAAGGSSQALVAGDFNGDGKLDLAVSNSNSVSILLGNGNGTFQPPVPYTVNGGGSIATGDFNGDGKPDLVVIGPSVSCAR